MKKTTWVFVFQKYGKFWSFSLGHSVENKPIISEQCPPFFFQALLCVEIVEVIPTRETAPGSLIIQFKSVAILPKREMCSAIKIQLSVMIFDQNSNKNDSKLISI